MLLWVAFQAVAGKKVWEESSMLVDAFFGALMGTSGSLLEVNGVLWFYTSLFTAVLVFYWLARNRSISWVLGLLVASAVLASFMPMLGMRLPWNIDLIFLAVAFYGAGFVVRDTQWVERLTSVTVLVAAVVAGALTLGITLVNKKVDMSWLHFGESYLLFLLGAFSGIAFFVLLGKLLPSTRVARYLADNAIIIYSIHFPMFFAFWGIGFYALNLPRDFDQASAWVAMLYIVGAFALSIPAVWFIRKFMPWGLGARGATKVQ